MHTSPGSIRSARRLAAPLFAVIAAISCGSPNKPGPVTTTPTITAVLPTSVSSSGGTAITVTGTNFGSDTQVFIDGAAVTGIVVNGGTTISATAPAHAAGVVNLTVSSGGTSVPFTGSFTYVAPSGANAKPVISQIRTTGPRANQPSSFANISDAIAVVATVSDNESSASQLAFAWTATTGTISGTSASATWTAPSTLATSPTTVTIQLVVTETFTEAGLVHKQTTTGTATVILHDSEKELLDLGDDFLRLFSMQVPYEQVLHNFSQTCDGGRGYSGERDDVLHNQVTFTQLPTWAIVKMPPVTLNFGGSCALPGRGPLPADACARLHAHWDVQPKSGGSVEHSDGVDEVTGVLENNQWRLCHSSFVADSAFPAALEHQVMLDVRTRIIKRY